MKYFQKNILTGIIAVIVVVGVAASVYFGKLTPNPAIAEEKTQNQLVGDLLEKAFSGSAEKLVMRALSAKKVSAKELAKIRKLLDELKGEKS